MSIPGLTLKVIFGNSCNLPGAGRLVANSYRKPSFAFSEAEGEVG